MQLSNRQLSHRLPLLLVLVAALSAPIPAPAAPRDPAPKAPRAAKAPPPSPVSVDLTVQRVVPDGNGGETFDSAENVRPGDTIAYVVVHRNPGKRAVKDVKATIPIPPGTEFLPSTAEPPIDEASLDGKTFSAPPLVRKVKAGDGKEEEREAHPSEYRSVRWDLKTLSPGQAVTVRTRMKIQGSQR